jgi:histone-lysine N-methyltransferase SETD3
MLITLEIAKESPIGNKILNSNIDLLSPKHCFLSVLLLQEKINPNSNWKHYLEILPKFYYNFPVFYKEDEIKELVGSPFLDLINQKTIDIKSDYDSIIKAVPELNKFTFEEFMEMRMVVSSRIFGIKIAGKKTDCLAPLADMLNHKRPRQTQWYFSDDIKSFIIKATQDIESDEQVIFINLDI